MAPRKGTKKPAYEGLTLEMNEKLNPKAIHKEGRKNNMGEECKE